MERNCFSRTRIAILRNDASVKTFIVTTSEIYKYVSKFAPAMYRLAYFCDLERCVRAQSSSTRDDCRASRTT